jgi:hypothetical protein
MRRYRTLAAIAVGTLLTVATSAAAAPVVRDDAAAVTAVRVVPGAGRADVVLSFDGDVQVTDFTLANPHRIVVDVRGATMQLRAESCASCSISTGPASTASCGPTASSA